MALFELLIHLFYLSSASPLLLIFPPHQFPSAERAQPRFTPIGSYLVGGLPTGRQEDTTVLESIVDELLCTVLWSL
jgi:hypothetical protein